MRKKFLALIALLAVLTAYGGISFANAASDSKSQTILITVTTSITLTLATTTVDLGTLSAGSPLSATTSLAVATNNSTGFNLQVKRDDATSTLNLNGTSTPDVTFPDATDWNYTVPNATTAALVGANLHFRATQGNTDAALYNAAWWGSDDTAPNALYAGFPAVNQQVANNGSYSSSSQTMAYAIQADAPGTQASGAYSGTVTFTAITNP